MAPDWRIAEDYAPIACAERKALAWEWLRRTESYNDHWRGFVAGRRMHCDARTFGLERFEDPSLATPEARPVWHAAIDPAVISAEISNAPSDYRDKVDLLAWVRLVSVAIGDDDSEHVLLSDGARTIRLDVLNGTLIGCPAPLSYHLDGIIKLERQISAFDDLIRLRKTGEFGAPPPSVRILGRWITELRVADALMSCASQQEIARVLYGPTIPENGWRTSNGSHRLRVQRLVRQARKRLNHPLDQAWFC